MTDAQPTARDIENAARRAEIAARQQREYDEALALAVSVFGPGWVPSGKHMLVDKAEEARARREHDRMQPAATVYSARDGTGRQRHFVLTEGRPVEVADYQEGFGSMLLESHSTWGFEKEGRWHAYHRYSLFWAGYELYAPKSAEQLAALRITRERKAEVRAVAQAVEDHPLFAEQIRLGQWRPETKPRGQARE